MVYREGLFQINRRLYSRYLSTSDTVGFLVAFLAALELVSGSEARLFAVLLAGFSAVVYLLIAQKVAPFYLRPSISGMLPVPFIAALLTLAAAATMRSYYSGTALLLFVMLWTAWLVTTRLVYSHFMPPLRTLVIGTPDFAADLRKLDKLSVTALGTPPDTFEDWDLVVLEPAQTYGRDWLQWLSHADIAGVRIVSAPVFLEVATGRVSTELLDGRWAPLLFHGRSLYTFWKRMFDLTITFLSLPVLLLVTGSVALAILIESGSPVLFWQTRTGKNGKPFWMVKFRSMYHNVQHSGNVLIVTTPVSDSRVTRLGAFLRQFRLDELPQFYNVVRGEMSIIGPRPEPTVLVEQFLKEIPLYQIRHHVRPGITGWSQVMQGYGQGTDDMREKLRYDIYYIRNLTLWLDLRIVLKTVHTVLTGFGAR